MKVPPPREGDEQDETGLTVRVNPKTIVMESYDQILIGSFFALPAFQKTFGFQLADGSYQVSAPWQSALSEDSAFRLQLLLSLHCNDATKEELILISS